MIGSVGYGTHIPRYRITVEEIAGVWGADAPAYKKGLNLNEKSVPGPDEDCATLSVGIRVQVTWLFSLVSVVNQDINA